ncbi:peptidoglycan editing factor PgeF [Alteromonas gracilis]
MFAFRDALGPVDLVFTDRDAGAGAASPLDLGRNPGDGDQAAARAAAESLGRVLDAWAPGAEAVSMRQVHGAAVDVLDDRDDRAPVEADALVTTGTEVLVVRVADCVPVLLAAPDEGVVAAVHAGRPGVEQGVVLRALEEMRRLGAASIHAWIGPHVCGACYEVPEDLRERVADAVPQTRATTRWGTPALDLGAGVRAQLATVDATVHDASRCTLESDDLWSHRRDGERAGRLAGLIRRRA